MKPAMDVVLPLALLVSGALAFTLWREPACGVLLVYSAVRCVLYGN